MWAELSVRVPRRACFFFPGYAGKCPRQGSHDVSKCLSIPDRGVVFLRKMRSCLWSAIMVLIGSTVVWPAGGADATGAVNCDRACLDGFVDRYLAALLAHDPARAPLAKGAKFTENGQILKLGDALWGTISGLGKYKFYFEDPQDGQVGFFGTIRENDVPAILAARLKVVNRQITEIETVVPRFDNTDDKNGPEELDALGKPNAVYFEAVPVAERVSRQNMIAIVNSYFDGLEKATGKDVPFDPKCDRLNNGELTTNNHSANSAILAMGCAEQFNSGFSKFMTRIRDRRFMLIDQERGLVFGVVFFDHAGRLKTVTLTNGTIFQVPPVYQKPTTLMVAELFKIKNGKILRIDAIEGWVTYGERSGWGQ